MDVNISPVPKSNARKRQANKDQWKRLIQKRNRYAPKTLPNINTVKCDHKNDKILMCNEIEPRDIIKFHSSFYFKHEKEYQDAFILKFLKVKVPRRCGSKLYQRKQPKTYTRLYIRKSTRPFLLVQVCQKFFLSILNIGVHRLRNIAKTFLVSGKLSQDKRGGDRHSHRYTEKKSAVMGFIESFKCIESHYCRTASSTRKYMASELNIKKMWRMYQDFQSNIELKVRQCYFRDIMNKNYNIGFKSPSTDVCSKCLELSLKIKNETNIQNKSIFMFQKRLHKLKSKCFYEYLREYNDEILTFSFDCQKNQVLPKIPDQAAYYSRQLYINNFTIVENNDKNDLRKESVFMYTWTEDRHAKGANEIASAVYHHLTQISPGIGIKTIRLMADGCGCQNKNSVMISMCAFWLINKAPSTIKNVQLIFPVPGHSFMPSDRIFGFIEKEIKNRQEIIDPSEYKQIYLNYGNVIELGLDCPVLDWKAAGAKILKPPNKYHFKFAPCKRYFIARAKKNPQKALLKGEINYKTELCAFKSFTKKHKTISQMNLEVINPFNVKLSQLKLNDVDRLIQKHFGQNWRLEFGSGQLKYYRDILERSSISENDNVSNENENLLCNYYPDETGPSV